VGGDTLNIDQQELADLKMAVECWLEEYVGASPEEMHNRVNNLWIRLDKECKSRYNSRVDKEK
jgi:hypothetical protein